MDLKLTSILSKLRTNYSIKPFRLISVLSEMITSLVKLTKVSALFQPKLAVLLTKALKPFSALAAEVHSKLSLNWRRMFTQQHLLTLICLIANVALCL